MIKPSILDSKNAALIVIDMQEAFRTAIPDFALIAAKTSTAIRGCAILGIPVIVTEQYPQGLGITAEELRFSLPENTKTIEKSTFSAFGSDAFVESLKSSGATQLVVCGIEAHICVNQTVHDLLGEGFQVHVLQDCVSSRSTHDKHTGLEKMKLSGAIPSNVEMALFELMRDSKHPKFREIQQLVK